MTLDSLAGNPYFSFRRRRYREERLAAYIRREHRRGRSVSDILADPYVGRCGSGLLRSVLCRADLIDALEQDVADAIRAAAPYPSAPGNQA